MGWREKFDVIRKRINDDSSFWNMCDLHAPASDEFIKTVVKMFPFADKEYLAFLRYTDGCRIEFRFILGSGAPHYIPDTVFSPSSFQSPSLIDEFQMLSDSLAEWRSIADLGLFMPIEKDIEGDYCLMLEDGRILQIDCDSKKKSNDIVIAPSFGEYLDEYIMGEKHSLLYGYEKPGDWDGVNENDWTRFLNDQGWWVH